MLNNKEVLKKMNSIRFTAKKERKKRLKSTENKSKFDSSSTLINRIVQLFRKENKKKITSFSRSNFKAFNKRHIWPYNKGHVLRSPLHENNNLFALLLSNFIVIYLVKWPLLINFLDQIVFKNSQIKIIFLRIQK